MLRRLVISGWLLAGCGGGHELHKVSIKGMAYEPPDLTVSPGDTIEWTNDDVVPHTVTAQGLFDSGSIASHGTFRTVAGKSGRVPYMCTLHVGMKGAFTVR